MIFFLSRESHIEFWEARKGYGLSQQSFIRFGGKRIFASFPLFRVSHSEGLWVLIIVFNMHIDGMVIF